RLSQAGQARRRRRNRRNPGSAFDQARSRSDPRGSGGIRGSNRKLLQPAETDGPANLGNADGRLQQSGDRGEARHIRPQDSATDGTHTKSGGAGGNDALAIELQVSQSTSRT